MKYYELDKHEEQILTDFEKGKLVRSPKVALLKSRYQQAAKATLAKTKNVNIRLTHKDLLKLKAKAAVDGIPYQTLISSLIHRYTAA
jgi:predicted DNA binding CopG/RHH family protein